MANRKIMNKGFTLVELIIVVVIIGILATFAIPQFATTKERALDNEARANLKLIQAAEKIYRMEIGGYYPASGSTGVIAAINDNLKLSLPESGTNWIYTVSTAATNATAARVGSGGRVWAVSFTGSDIPTCSGAGCP